MAGTLLLAASAGAQDAPSDRLPGNDATLRDTPAVTRLEKGDQVTLTVGVHRNEGASVR